MSNPNPTDNFESESDTNFAEVHSPEVTELLIKFNSLQYARTSLFLSVQNILKKLNSPIPPETYTIQPILKRLEVLEADYRKNEEKILDVNFHLPEHLRINIFDTRTEFDAYVAQARDECSKFLQVTPSSAPTPTCPSPSPLSNVRLPNINIPLFSGTLNQWSNFYNLFNVTIHESTSLSAIEKFQYLLTFLKGEALDHIKNLPLTPANYEIAWKLIKQHYQSERRHVMNYLNNIIELPELTATNLGVFLSKIFENMQGLEAMNYKNDYKLMMMAIILKKFNPYHKKRFHDFQEDSSKVPTLNELLEYLEKELVLSTEMEKQFSGSSSQKNVKICPSPSPKVFHAKKDTPQFTRNARPNFSSTPQSSSNTQTSRSQTNDSTNLCPFCSSPTSHSPFHCSTFLALSVTERMEKVKQLNRCFNCFHPHRVNACPSRRRCGAPGCNRAHHTLLHVESTRAMPTLMNFADSSSHVETSCVSPQNPASIPPPVTPQAISQSYAPLSNATPVSLHPTPTVLFTQTNHSSVNLLPTLHMLLTTPTGKKIKVRGLLDSGAQQTFVTLNVAKALNLKTTPSLNEVSGLAGNNVAILGNANINILTCSNKLVSTNHPTVIVEKITNPLPACPVEPHIRDLFRKYYLADFNFDKGGEIDCLLGTDLYCRVVTSRPINFGDSMPSLLNTVFGHVIMGHIPIVQETTPLPRSISLFSSSCLLSSPSNIIGDNNSNLDPSYLNKQIEKFWTLENIPTQKKTTPDDEFAEKFYSETTVQQPNGRYMVKLPIKPNHPPLGESYNLAKKRFDKLESRLTADKTYSKLYLEFMAEYLKNGFMIEVPTPSVHVEHFYLPHHGVLRENSSTTKLRVVFDAGAKTSTGYSLNDILYAGPKLQNAIPDILMNFRKHEVVFSSDIKQMYLQIDLHPEHHLYQLILWRENSSLPLKTYALRTVTFGISASPFLAIRTLHQIASDHGRNYPQAAKVITEDAYVDDVISGESTPSKAKKLLLDLNLLLSKGGFCLRKWTSNCPSILEGLPPEHLEKPKVNMFDVPQFSILGLKWSPVTDNFSYSIKPPPSPKSKRDIVSLIATIFDPCGWITPISLKAKAFMQELWLLKFDWDDPLPPEILNKWKKFIELLPCLNSLIIPRRITVRGGTTVQLHGFCDASELGFSAALYLRSPTNDGFDVKLLVAKSRVAPLKKLSLPRLELCAASLLFLLYDRYLPKLKENYSVEKIYAWSDSTVTLTWIQTPSYRLKTFVGNRVADIQSLSDEVLWRHIKSADNPADCASRGVFPSEIENLLIWWNGPVWLKSPETDWPVTIPIVPSCKVVPEMRSISSVFLTVFDRRSLLSLSSVFFSLFVTNKPGPDELPVSPVWDRSVRIFAYVLRFGSRPLRKGPLTLTEIRVAEMKMILVIQQESFKTEITALKKNNPCSTSVQKLAPFLDNNNLIRVGGRLRHANIPLSAKNQILLPPHHPLVQSLVEKYHIQNLHPGPQLLQSLLRNRFWILSGKNLIRSVVHQCIPCFKAKPTNLPPLMGDLPPSRVQPNPVFSHSGMDFAGPFSVKIHQMRSARTVQVYLCVFVCMSTKAVHIEVVHGLSTPAFIAALHRFVSRRGLPSHLYSDQGRNFVGAANSFQKLLSDSNIEFRDYLIDQKIEFVFNPPHAPHQGGLWEAAVKSIKHHLRRTIGNHILILEEFQTLVYRVEAILNSRPISPLSVDPNDLQPLTPGHFLIGRPLVSLPEFPMILEQIPIRRRWKLVEAMVQEIWNLWQRDYLHNLQIRGKWNKVTPSLEVDSLVLIHDPNLPPLKWKLGRVIQVVPDSQGHTRIAYVKTDSGILQRPTLKLYPLPLDED